MARVYLDACIVIYLIQGPQDLRGCLKSQPRRGRRHKAWGFSPRTAPWTNPKPRRGAGFRFGGRSKWCWRAA